MTSARPHLQLAFRDFWPGFIPDSSFIVRTLRRRFDLTISDRDGILVFGPFGNDHASFTGVKVYCSGEPVALPTGDFDFSISWHALASDRGLRLPVYAWTILESPEDVSLLESRAWFDWSTRPHFCNFVFSNWNSRQRRDFFRVLSRRRFVHAPGDVENNVPRLVGGRTASDWRVIKMEYQRAFRFTIAFENESIPGYTSEKVVDALLAGTIPIYWGNPKVRADVDPSTIICAEDFGNLEELADYVCRLDDDRKAAQPYFERAAFAPNVLERWEGDLVALFQQADEAATRLRPSRHLRAGRLAARRDLDQVKVTTRIRAGRLTRRFFGAPTRTYLGFNAGSTAGTRSRYPDLTIASAANDAYFDSLLTLIASIHRLANGLEASILCLDLGLRRRQRALLERIEGVQVRSIPEALASQYPHLLEPKTFAWKIWLLHELANEDHPFLYVDAGACFVQNPAQAFAVIRQHGILLVDQPGRTNERWTHQAARSIMAATEEELSAHQLSANVIGAQPTAVVRAFFGEALEFALNPNCIRGDEHEHRWDQSILAILSHRRNLPRVRIERFGEWRGVLHDDQVIYAHRRAHINHSGLRWARPPAVQSLVRPFVGLMSRKAKGIMTRHPLRPHEDRKGSRLVDRRITAPLPHRTVWERAVLGAERVKAAKRQLDSYRSLWRWMSVRDARRLRRFLSQSPGESPRITSRIRIRPLGVKIPIRAGTADALDVLDSLLGRYHLPPSWLQPSTIVDAGLCTGLTLIDFALQYPHARVVGIEPQPYYANLCRSLASNFDDRVTVLEAALAPEDGTRVPFYVTRGNEFGGSVLEPRETMADHVYDTVTVSLNSIVADTGQIDYLKLDVEGAEREILNRNTDWASRTRCMKIELHEGYEVDECIRDLARLGFRGVADETHWAAVVALRQD